jgi:hypothetical protein
MNVGRIFNPSFCMFLGNLGYQLFCFTARHFRLSERLVSKSFQLKAVAGTCAVRLVRERTGHAGHVRVLRERLIPQGNLKVTTKEIGFIVPLII